MWSAFHQISDLFLSCEDPRHVWWLTNPRNWQPRSLAEFSKIVQMKICHAVPNTLHWYKIQRIRSSPYGDYSANIWSFNNVRSWVRWGSILHVHNTWLSSFDSSLNEYNWFIGKKIISFIAPHLLSLKNNPFPFIFLRATITPQLLLDQFQYYSTIKSSSTETNSSRYPWFCMGSTQMIGLVSPEDLAPLLGGTILVSFGKPNPFRPIDLGDWRNLRRSVAPESPIFQKTF